MTSLTRNGNGLITSAQWPAHFAGCIYVESLDQAFCPDGRFLPRKVYAVRYGGYRFAMDASGTEHTTDPWEAWTQHRVHAPTIVTGISHDPDLPHGAIAGRLLNVNPSDPKPQEAARELLRRRRAEGGPALQHAALRLRMSPGLSAEFLSVHKRLAAGCHVCNRGGELKLIQVGNYITCIHVGCVSLLTEDDVEGFEVSPELIALVDRVESEMQGMVQ